MKLTEVINTHFHILKRKNTALAASQEAGEERVDSGSFGFVRKTPTDPFSVNKAPTFEVDLADDPYFQYVHRIVDDELAASNHYFPRIYAVKVITASDKDMSVRYNVNMETLTELDMADDTELTAMAYRMYGEAIVDKAKQNQWFSWNDFLTKGMTQWLSGDDSWVKDSQLVAALELIQEIKQTRVDFKYDVRYYNCMFRRSSVGPQLVLTDPLYNTKASHV